ncbi:MAG: hypothetical protein IJR99_04785 [Kiritimatiellae bacterium]|nr:hypothetical protein [Kiritimatiellia bacterium]
MKRVGVNGCGGQYRQQLDAAIGSKVNHTIKDGEVERLPRIAIRPQCSPMKIRPQGGQAHGNGIQHLGV